MTPNREKLKVVIDNPKKYGLKKSERPFQIMKQLLYEGVVDTRPRCTLRSEDDEWIGKVREVLTAVGVAYEEYNIAPRGGMKGNRIKLAFQEDLDEIEKEKPIRFQAFVDGLIEEKRKAAESGDLCAKAFIDMHDGHLEFNEKFSLNFAYISKKYVIPYISTEGYEVLDEDAFYEGFMCYLKFQDDLKYGKLKRRAFKHY